LEKIKVPVLIVGAGPAGCCASFELSKSSIQHIILEKDTFPRDKICGDALSGKVLDILDRSHPEFLPEFEKRTDVFIPSPGIRFYGPNGKKVDIPCPPRKDGLTAGFVAKREGFDQLLTEHLNADFCTLYQKTSDLSFESGNKVTFCVGEKQYEVEYDIVMGADGARSKTAEHFVGRIIDKDHHSAAVRAYYTNVTGFENNFIELHFIKDLLPGYFWVFPLPNNEANVGLGMLSSKIVKNKVNLRNRLVDVVENHPALRDRFKNAKLQGSIKGWGLPLGSKKRQLSGDNFMLIGDAGWLIDPFTGEGIGNAFVSGRSAAKWAVEAVKKGDYSASYLQQYDAEIYGKLWEELKLSHRLQRLSSIKWLFNYLINKATNSKKLQETMTLMYTSMDMRAKLKNPLFYLSLLKGD